MGKSNLYRRYRAWLRLKNLYSCGSSGRKGSNLSLDGFTVEPQSTLIVWQRPKGCKLSVEDFNARYGTSFVLGKDILVTEQQAIFADKMAHMIDLCYGEEERLTRVTYGTYCGGALPRADMADQYRYASDMTIHETRFLQAAATPGKIGRMQALHVVASPSRRKVADKVMAITDLTKSPLTLVQRVKKEKPQAAPPAPKKPSALEMLFGTKPTKKK